MTTDRPEIVQLVQLNVALAQALGVTSVTHLARLKLTLQPGKLPEVEATYRLRSADGLQEAVERFYLRPSAMTQEATSAG